MTAPTISTTERLRTAYEALQAAKIAHVAAEQAFMDARLAEDEASEEFRTAKWAHLSDVLGVERP